MGAVVKLERQQFADGKRREPGLGVDLKENGNFTKCCGATGQHPAPAGASIRSSCHSARRSNGQPTIQGSLAPPSKALAPMRQGRLQTPQIQHGLFIETSSTLERPPAERQPRARRAPTASPAHECGLCFSPLSSRPPKRRVVGVSARRQPFQAPLVTVLAGLIP